MACMNAMSRKPVFRVEKIIKNERLNGISQSALIVLLLLLKGRCKTYFNKLFNVKSTKTTFIMSS